MLAVQFYALELVFIPVIQIRSASSEQCNKTSSAREELRSRRTWHVSSVDNELSPVCDTGAQALVMRSCCNSCSQPPTTLPRSVHTDRFDTCDTKLPGTVVNSPTGFSWLWYIINAISKIMAIRTYLDNAAIYRLFVSCILVTRKEDQWLFAVRSGVHRNNVVEIVSHRECHRTAYIMKPKHVRLWSQLAF